MENIPQPIPDETRNVSFKETAFFLLASLFLITVIVVAGLFLLEYLANQMPHPPAAYDRYSPTVPFD